MMVGLGAGSCGLMAVNPFTALACKIFGLKGAHADGCKQYIFHSCNKSTFNAVNFHGNLSHANVEKKKGKKKA